MTRRWPRRPRTEAHASHRLRTDGGEEDTADAEDADATAGDESPDQGGEPDDAPEERAAASGDDAGDDDEAAGSEDDHEGDTVRDPGGAPGLDRSNVEVTEAGTAEPADPKWEKPDPEDIPEFETGAEKPLERSSGGAGVEGAGGKTPEDPTEGMPNEARSPGNSRIKREGGEGYVAALELCARLPDDVRLPEQAADLVPAAVEAELEQDVQAFAAAEFDEHSPTVDVLEFVERDGEIWLRLRLGVPEDGITDLDPDAVRAHALEELEGLL
jgi:hypothetical protein